MQQPAPAKINLFLHVGARRADGFHPLQSLAVFTDLGDTLTFTPSPSLSLTLDGPFAAGLAAEPDNLVLRAARALEDRPHLRRLLPAALWGALAAFVFNDSGIVAALLLLAPPTAAVIDGILCDFSG